MEETMIKKLTDLTPERVLGSGNPMCAGCGAMSAIHHIYDILGEKTVFVNAAGCMTLLSIYPYTPFPGSWLYTAMASASAGAQGIRDALDVRLRRGKMEKGDDLTVVVLTGDGSAGGIGLSATANAVDRGLDFICICYDNEGYGNTGHQASGATPLGARTATSKGAGGYAGSKRDLFSVWTAHKPTYAATVTAAEPLDLAKKVEKARGLSGPRMLITLAPCPSGWGTAPADSVKLGKLAVKTGLWPLKEYVGGKVVYTKIPRKRSPVKEYLELQGRFAHLFSKDNPHGERILEEIERSVEDYWSGVTP